jgi:FkbM family methyltransferase
MAHRVVKLGRKLVGKGDRCVVTRRGVKYDLDLSQGIDFALFLNRYEPNTRAALTRLVKPGATVVDVGANIGAMALHLADRVGPSGRVFCFEPTDYAFTRFQRNIELNPQLAGRISAYQCFLSGTDDSAMPQEVYSAWPLETAENLHEKHLGQPMTTRQATSRSLDSVLAENGSGRVQLVKLDVDGFECDVLRGATKLLTDDKPIFVMELAPYCLDERGTSLEEMLSFFVPNGYRLYDEAKEQPLPTAAGELLAMIGDGASMNVIARATSA